MGGKIKGGQLGVSFLESSESGLEIEEIPDAQVNVATGRAILSAISGGSAWGNKVWPNECSGVIEAGFDGGGLRIYSRFRRYTEYILRFQPNASVGRTIGCEMRFSSGSNQFRRPEKIGRAQFGGQANSSRRP